MEYYVQQIAGNYLKNVSDEPDVATIHPGYLYGVDREQFQEGFSALQQLFRRLYADIAKNPSGFGMLLKETIEKNAKDSRYTLSNASFVRVPNLLFILGAWGVLLPDLTLHIEGGKLLSAAKELKITNLPFLLKKLSEHGFELVGTDRAIKDSGVLSVSYPDNRYLMTALKAMAVAQLKLNKGDMKKQKNYFYMLHSGLLEKETVKAPRLTVNNILRTLDNEKCETARTLSDIVAETCKADVRMGGFMRNDWSCVFTGYKDKKVLMSLNVEQDKLSAKLNLQHIGRYIGIIMMYPDYIRDTIRSSGWECGHCHDTCAGGFAFEMEGRSYNKCRCGSFLFDNISINEIP